MLQLAPDAIVAREIKQSEQVLAERRGCVYWIFRPNVKRNAPSRLTKKAAHSGVICTTDLSKRIVMDIDFVYSNNRRGLRSTERYAAKSCCWRAENRRPRASRSSTITLRNLITTKKLKSLPVRQKKFAAAMKEEFPRKRIPIHTIRAGGYVGVTQVDARAITSGYRSSTHSLF